MRSIQIITRRVSSVSPSRRVPAASVRQRRNHLKRYIFIVIFIVVVVVARPWHRHHRHTHTRTHTIPAHLRATTTTHVRRVADRAPSRSRFLDRHSENLLIAVALSSSLLVPLLAPARVIVARRVVVFVVVFAVVVVVVRWHPTRVVIDAYITARSRVPPARQTARQRLWWSPLWTILSRSIDSIDRFDRSIARSIARIASTSTCRPVDSIFFSNESNPEDTIGR
jgi:hypothetical protein